jgi:nucleoside-diphosphate-sugar epimerase
MRHLVTGATGDSGGDIARQPREAGHELVALVRERSRAALLVALGTWSPPQVRPAKTRSDSAARASGEVGCPLSTKVRWDASTQAYGLASVRREYDLDRLAPPGRQGLVE